MLPRKSMLFPYQMPLLSPERAKRGHIVIFFYHIISVFNPRKNNQVIRYRSMKVLIPALLTERLTDGHRGNRETKTFFFLI